jgi:hypothetical protein
MIAMIATYYKSTVRVHKCAQTASFAKKFTSMRNFSTILRIKNERGKSKPFLWKLAVASQILSAAGGTW